MQPLNIVEIETPWGYRTFELYQSDVADLDFHIDMVIFSAFADGYEPTPGTLIGALHDRFQINIASLANAPWLDLRPTLGCWVSTELSSGTFTRLLGVELVGGSLDIGEALSNVFVAASVAEMKGVTVKTLALPVLGAGNQMLDAKEVISVVLPNALEYLRRSPHAERVVFVEINPQRAMLLNDAMNEILGRVKIVLPKGHLVSGVRKEILDTVARARGMALGPAQLLGDLQRVVASEASRSFEVGIIARRLAEAVVHALAPAPGEIDLYAKIERTSSLGLSPWIRSYLHVLRVFGNESAHERGTEARTPASINEADLALCYFCLLRVLAFYVDWHRARGISLHPYHT